MSNILYALVTTAFKLRLNEKTIFFFLLECVFWNFPFLQSFENGQNVSTAQFGEGISHNTIGNFIIY